MRRLLIALAATGAVAVGGAATGPAIEIAPSRTAFHVNGSPRFVGGISVFDALGPTSLDAAALDLLQRSSITTVRVWAHWRQAVYGPDGRLAPAGRQRLLRLADELARRGLVLELVLLRPGQLPGQGAAHLTSAAARRTAVEELTGALAGRPGIVFDLFNEHDHPDGGVHHRELRELRDAVKQKDPRRLVTASSTEFHIMTAEGRFEEEEGLRNLEDDVREVGADFLSLHLPRTPDWADATAARVKMLVDGLARFNLRVPIYLSEERRAQEGEPPIAAGEYARAAAAARDAGAAGWVLHTSAGYALDERSLMRALGQEEREALGLLQPLFAGPPRTR